MRTLQFFLSCSAATSLLSACEPPESTELGAEHRTGTYSLAETKTKYFAIKPSCPSYSCGLNSPFIGHELNVEGVPNAADVRFVGAHHASQGPVQIEVDGDELIGHAGGVELRDNDLIGLAIELEGETDSGTVPLTVKLVEVAWVDMWASGPYIDDATAVPSYKFVYDAPGVKDQLLCPSPREGTSKDPAELALATYQAELFDEGALEELFDLNETLSGPSRAHHAVLFSGERVDYDTAEILDTEKTDWFNWGCAGSSAAKLHLTGHTASGSARLGVSAPTHELTQTMLYAYTATYCPGSQRMTVPGQPVRVADERGLLPRSGEASFAPTASGTVEALWGPHGAVCLSTPRLEADVPTIWDAIAEACGELPPCDPRDTVQAADLDGSLLTPDVPIVTFNLTP